MNTNPTTRPAFARTLGIFLCLAALASCKNDYPDYPTTPSVEFISATVSESESDHNIAFTFLLKDGDGNFGLSPTDTSAPFIGEFQQNLHAKAHSLDDGVATELPYEFSYRIPRLRAEGYGKFIKAEVSVEIALGKATFPYDRIFFTYFVYDRDLQKSNTDTSAVILLR